MLKIKRDYLYSSKVMILIAFSIMIFLAILFLFIMNINGGVFWSIGYEGVNKFLGVGTGFICSIPLATFGCILPTSEKSFSGKIKTNHLPLTNKQLAWRGIKLWLLTYLVWITMSISINLLYEMKAINNSVSTMATAFSMRSLGEVFLFNIIYIVLITIFVLIVNMQIISSMIIFFAKNINILCLIIIQILINSMIILVAVFLINKFNINIKINSTESFISFIMLVSTLLIGTVIYFLYSLKYIEKVYR